MTPSSSRRRRLLILAICCLSLFIVGLDNTIVNVALPSIQRDLHASVSGLQWMVDAYTLVLASLLMLSGSTADRVGRRRTFQTGLAMFTLGSLLCSLAPEPGLAGRVPHAAGRRRLDAQPGGDVDHHEHVHRPGRAGPGHRRLGRRWSGSAWRSARWSAGCWSASVGWRGIFWVNIPVGLAAIVLTALFVPESRAPAPAAARPGRPGAGHRDAGLADLRDHRGPAARAGPRPVIIGCFALAAAALAGADPLRAAARGAAARPAVLPQRAVLRGDRDRGLRVRRARRVPVPQHAVPAGRARLLGAARRAVTLPMAAMTVVCRAAVRPDRRPPGPAAAAGGRRGRP